MKAMIMAAGVGSRLMPLTVRIPKPMVPVANQPLMENIIRLLQAYGFNNIIANLHYHSRVISDYFGKGEKYGVSLKYSPEEELMGTAGGVKKCEWFLDDTFVVISGDALTDINLAELVEKHRSHGAIATIALKEVEEVENFGVVITSEDGEIQSFQEKPKRAEALSNMANTGIYIFEPEIFKYIPRNQFYDFGKQVFPHLVKLKAPFYGFSTTDYWCDIGNIGAYRQAHADILQKRVKTNPKGEIIYSSSEARVLAGNKVQIGNRVRFKGNVVLGSGCIIEDDTELDNCVIWDNTRVGKKVIIKDAVIGSSCQVKEQAEICSGAVIASGCSIPEETIIPEDSKVFETGSERDMIKKGS